MAKPKIKVPDWLESLKPTAKDERIRTALGLYPKRDGWYKSIGGETRYVCKPCSVLDARNILEAKLATVTTTEVVVGHMLSLEQLAETFLAQMLERVKLKDMARSTYDDYVRVLAAFAEVVGPEKLAGTIGPQDFSAYIKTISSLEASTVRRHIQYIDRLFNWAGPGKKAMNWIPVAVRGPDWNKPSDEEIGESAADRDKAYSPAQIVAAFDAVKDHPLLNAAAHLGLNGAFGPKDLADLPESLVDLENAIIRYPRGKTGVGRICPMLEPTIKAVRAWLEQRGRFKSIDPSAEGLLFRTREGFPMAKWFQSREGGEAGAGYRDNILSRRWSQVVGLPFSGLRSTFATHADDWIDQRAIDVVMGHKVGHLGRHIRRHYAKQFSPDRARALVEAVWTRAFGKAAPSPTPLLEVKEHASSSPGDSASTA